MRTALISQRWVVGLVCAGILLFGGVFLMVRTKAPVPLPFDAGGLVATTSPTIASLPPNASLKDRISQILIFKVMTKLQRANKYLFPPTPTTNRCSVQGLLNECAGVTGERYLMPPFVAAGTVRFGNTNALNGPQWVSAFENALETGTPEWWDAEQKKMREENLVLIRFPEQKTVLVLPQEKAAEFQRTNQFGKVDEQGQ
jgi:hypothetical protein